jgi:hypothetical protein
MPLTKEFKETIKARAERDPEFRVGLLREAIEALLSDDLESGKVLLRDYVNATVGFETLAEEMEKNPKSLMRMLSDKDNPCADNLLAMVARLKRREDVSFSVTRNNGLHASPFIQRALHESMPYCMWIALDKRVLRVHRL